MEGIHAFAEPLGGDGAAGRVAADASARVGSRVGWAGAGRDTVTKDAPPPSEAPFSVLLVSDNNLSPENPTQIVKFRVVGGVYVADGGRPTDRTSGGMDQWTSDWTNGSNGVSGHGHGDGDGGNAPPLAALGMSAAFKKVTDGVGGGGAVAGTLVVVLAAVGGLFMAHRRLQGPHSTVDGGGASSAARRRGGGGGVGDVESNLLGKGNYSYGLVASPQSPSQSPS